MGTIKQQIANSTYSDTETIIGPIPLTKKLKAGGFEIDRAGLTNSSLHLSLLAQYSIDSGKTWRTWAGVSTFGGGQTTEPTVVQVTSVPPRNSLVQVRVWTNGPSAKQVLRFVEVD